MAFDSRKQIAPKALVLINRHSGTVRSRGAEVVQKQVAENLQASFSQSTVQLFEGDIAVPLRKGLQDGSYTTVIAGGGDGTISAAAAELLGTAIPLGVLPLGTMNLFSRALGFSQDLEVALGEFARAKELLIDVGQINDRLFLRQVSFGLQPRLVRLREKIGYRDRISKMLGAVRAFTALAANPKQVRIRLDVDGTRQKLSVPLLIVSNNRLGQELNFSVQSSLTDGELGVYALKQFTVLTLVGLAKDHLTNRLVVNPALDMMTARAVTLAPRRNPFTLKRPKAILASIDGELATLSYPVRIGLKPESLKVWSLRGAVA